MTGGYISDVSYVAEFYGDHAPSHMNLVAVASGFRPIPLDQPFTWCDYGCGNGVTAAVLAACYPHAQFYGIDFLADHIRMAQTLALRGAVANVTFLQKNFATLGKSDLPPLDFAVMHGVLSWVDQATRDAVLDDAAKRIKPGGILLTGTNAMPGWAARMPMRNMIHSLSRDGENSLTRARKGLDWLQKLKGAEAKYFRDNPALGRAVDELEKLDLRYMAHEYFNENLRAFYFAELKALLEPRGFQFAGSATVFLNMVDLAVPLALRDDLRSAKSRTELEAKRDFIRNESFRRDIWVKGECLTDEQEWLALQQDLVLGTLAPPAKLDKRAAFGDIELSYENPPFAPLLKLLSTQARRISDLRGAPELQGLDDATLVEAARLLTAGGQVMAMPKPTRAHKVTRGTKISLPAVNRGLTRELAPRMPRIALAATKAGTGIELRNTDAFLLQAYCEHGHAGAAAAAARIMVEQGDVVLGGKTLAPAEIAAMLAGRLDYFEAGFLDKLAEIGVISVEP